MLVGRSGPAPPAQRLRWTGDEQRDQADIPIELPDHQRHAHHPQRPAAASVPQQHWPDR